MLRWDMLAALLFLAGIRGGATFGLGDIFNAGSDLANSILGGSSAKPEPMYLILKIDFTSSGTTNVSLIQPAILNEVTSMLATGFPPGSFLLNWVVYEQ